MQNENIAERICEITISEQAKKRRSLRTKIEDHFDKKNLNTRFGIDDFMHDDLQEYALGDIAE